MFGTALAILGLAALSGLVLPDVLSAADDDDDDDDVQEKTENNQINSSYDLISNLTVNDIESDAQTTEASDHAPGASEQGASEQVHELVTEDYDIEDMPPPLSDWSQSSSLPIITPEQSTDVIDILLPPEFPGKLHILQANYEQGLQAEGIEVARMFTGLNVYFVPEGESFPENYSWSEEGGALYNTETFINNPEDFGGTKLIARIDTGSLFFEYDADNSIVTDNTVDAPKISSNLELVFN